MNNPDRPDDTERQLQMLCPAAPSDALLARLHAARPTVRSATAAPPQHEAPTPRFRWRPLLGIAAAGVAVAMLAGGKFAVRPSTVGAPSTAMTSPVEAEATAGPTRATVTPVASNALRPVFLPVETSRRLVSLQSVPTIQRPDEAPHRMLRAVFLDDMTAVGADTDAALHLRRTHEIYLPVRSPVY